MAAALLLLLAAAAASAPDARIDGWRRAAQAGDAKAALKLGRAYRLGADAPRDATEAERWLARSAAAGLAGGEAEYGLALFENGKRQAAAPYLRRAAERGDRRAQYAYATMLFNGGEVAADAVQARRWMKRAADAGLPAAAEALAIMSAPLPHDARAPEPIVAPNPALAVWRVQVGAFAERVNAERLWTRLKPLGADSLAPAYATSGRLTRLILGPFDTAKAAMAYCQQVQHAGFACFAVKGPQVRD